eukprot:TRINITY_DN12238_c0_g1_i1.p1 TRINITY_DN12238_c0_g1~~TRINITY_DN12238_c0_g1_i1.p1  ORF type:complete len:117 (-),score=28.49 TRINITY_DN12238_c0_g1_i1:26-352(-)
MQHIESYEALEEALKESTDKFVCIEYGAGWCQPCKILGPKVEEFAGEHSESLFLYVDIDNEDLQDHEFVEDVTALPTFRVLKDNAIVKSISGCNFEQVAETYAEATAN